jgi:NADPH:quinone reductase-like Zn-dependent oxidoreductase
MLAATIVDGRVEIREHPDPVPGVGQIRVQVQAAGINSADLIQVQGLYPAPPGVPADITGLELAGIVDAVGPGAARFSPGDAVMAVVGGGAHAELAVLHEREAMPVPAGVDIVSAGGIPEAFTTAHDALFTQAGLTSGERLLVHGAAGGVGVAGVQLGVVAGAHVTATVRSAAKRDEVATLGATVVDPVDAGHGGPYDVILELVGAPNMAANLDSLATGGRVCVIGIGAGARAEINLGVLMGRRARIHGSTLRARPIEGKADAARRMEAQVLPHFAAGHLQVPIHATFPLGEAPDAFEHFAAGSKFGKIVLLPVT